MKIWNTLLSLFLGSTLSLWALPSAIDPCEIDSLSGLSVTMTDNSVFAVNGIFSKVVSTWNSGDEIFLAQTDLTYFPPAVINVGGTPIASPMVVLANTTQDTYALAHLTVAANPTPILLQTIDLVNSVIALSNATAWKIRPVDRRYFTEWQVTDIIMIGENIGSDRSVYDAIIFNVTRFDTARAYQVL